MEAAEGGAGGGDDDAKGSGGGTHRRPALAPRIKRMMQARAPPVQGACLLPRRYPLTGTRAPTPTQADDDVGKIAGLTPLAVGKAMELFLGTVVTKACAVAKKRGAKLLSTGHLKESLAGEELYDFLQDVVSSAPDLPPLTGGEGKQPKGASRGAGGAAAKRKAPARVAKEGADLLDDDDGGGEEGEEDIVPKKKAKPRAAPAKSAGGAQQAAAAPPGDAVQEAHDGAAAKAAPPVEEVPLAFAAAAVAPPADIQGEEDYDC